MILGVFADKGMYKGKNLLLFLGLLAAVFVFQLVDEGGSTMEGSADLAFLTDNEIVYTAHGKCRMDCRKIDKSEIAYILKNGKINQRKSDANDTPCPSYAVEGRTPDGQLVRIVFADCNNATKVVTAIDLENNYDCYCK